MYVKNENFEITCINVVFVEWDDKKNIESILIVNMFKVLKIQYFLKKFYHNEYIPM